MIKTTAVVILGLGAASAFAPAARTVSRGSSLFEFAGGLVGGEGPEPMPFAEGSSANFDPLSLAENAPEWLPWFREAELKHCRVAMLACAGMVVPEFVRIPGEAYSFENIPYVIDAHDKLPQSMIQIFLWISYLEAVSLPAVARLDSWDRAPGDFSFDPLSIFPTDPAKQKEMQLSELKNGRLAMIAIGGMVAGASVTGHHFPYLP